MTRESSADEVGRVDGIDNLGTPSCVSDQLSREVQDKLGQICYFGQIDSTNSYLLDRVNELPNLSVCLAAEQVSGRGSRGKSWRSQAGSGLYCSVLFHHNGAVADLPPLSIVAAIAMARTFSSLLPKVPYGVKWPNDVLTANGKLCGVLVESILHGKSSSSWVIGLGVNLRSQFTDQEQQLLPYAVTDFEREGFVSANGFWTVAERLLDELESLLSCLPSKQDLPKLFRQVDLFESCQITLRFNDSSKRGQAEVLALTGVAEGLAADGGFLFSGAEADPIIFYSGDISIDVNASDKRFVTGDVSKG
jgi:biotin-[acetyl-CoA-carboxylase] ligase BirA-like protein